VGTVVSFVVVCLRDVASVEAQLAKKNATYKMKLACYFRAAEVMHILSTIGKN